MGIKEWLMLITLSVLWGGSFFFVEFAITELPTLTIVLVRVALAAATLWLFILITGVSVPSSLSIWGSFFNHGFIE